MNSRRVGVLIPYAESDSEGQAHIAAFLEGLQQHGWTEGRNIRIEYRWAPDEELVHQFAKELVALQPDLIFTQNTPTTASILQQTRTIPIVFVGVSDPIGSGFVASFPPAVLSRWRHAMRYPRCTGGASSSRSAA
jgi:putative ABC transport system substrate-binding protein